MFIKSIITGSVITAILVSVLAATRLMKFDADKPDVNLYDVGQTMIPSPPEPPMDEEEQVEEEEPVESLPLAPIPALDLLADSSIDSIALPLTTATVDPNLAVSPFAIDRDPADLPVVKAAPRPVVKKQVKSKYKAKYKAKYKPKKIAPRRVTKSHYSPSDLDSYPRELRKGTFSWPSSAKGTSGSVKLQLEIGATGRVTVLSVYSSTDSKLNAAAKKVAKYSRFTAPTYGGRPVKTKFYKTYHLKKPRR